MSTNRVSTNTKGPLFWIVIVALGVSFAGLAIGVVGITIGLSAQRSATETAQKQADAAKVDTDNLRLQVDEAIRNRQAQVAATNAKVTADVCLVLNSRSLRSDPSIGGLRADLHCGPVQP